MKVLTFPIAVLHTKYDEGTAKMASFQVLEQKVVSREYHLRWRGWLRWARPLPPPTMRRLTESSEEYDCLHPLPVIPKLKHVRSMPLVPSAAEQRSPPDARKNIAS